MTMKEIALACISRGWYVFPCWPQTKQPMTAHGWKDASKFAADIDAWWARSPEANVAIACAPSGLCILDIDKGLTTIEDFNRWSLDLHLPPTLIVRTGRRPGLGLQLYFTGQMRDIGGWDLNGCSGDIKSMGGYVMAPGCVHPDSKERYETLLEPDKLAAIPSVISGLKRREERPVEPGKKIPEGSGRHDALMRVACGLRARGLDGDALLEAMEPINRAMCEVPIADEELRAMCYGIERRYPAGGAEPVAILGGTKVPISSAEVLEDTEDEEDLQDDPRPRYPDEVWAGTFYGEFADFCTQDNYVPKKFFSESIRTVVGAIVGDRLKCPMEGVNPRAYTIKIAPPGTGKGLSDERTRNFFAGERWDGLVRTEEPLIWGGADNNPWKPRGIGAQISTAASAPGLMKTIETKKLKKGETANPLAMWKPMPRVISLTEEARALFANFANESTGAGLESVLCELFDRDSFTTTATKDRPPASGGLMFSLLGGITKEGWDSVFSKTESTDSGFLSRVNILGTEQCKTKSGLHILDYSALRARFLPFLEALERNPKVIDASPSAMGYMDKWFSSLILPEGVSRARLNIHAWRTALHLAWLKGHAAILEDDVDGGRKVAEFLAAMREFYAPPEGETRGARCEAAIRKVMRARRKMTVRELRRMTNSTRYGLGTWDKALQALVKATEIRAEVQGKKIWVILLKSSG